MCLVLGMNVLDCYVNLILFGVLMVICCRVEVGDGVKIFCGVFIEVCF